MIQARELDGGELDGTRKLLFATGFSARDPLIINQPELLGPSDGNDRRGGWPGFREFAIDRPPGSVVFPRSGSFAA